MGKWNVINTVENEFYNNTAHVTANPATAGDYADFRNNGKIYSKEGVYLDSASYGISAENK